MSRGKQTLSIVSAHVNVFSDTAVSWVSRHDAGGGGMFGRMRRSDASADDAEVTRTRGRVWGPFTGRQLTAIACVAIVAAIAIPTAALAAIGTFTSTTVAPAVTGTNSATVANANGVQGSATATNANTRYGVTARSSVARRTTRPKDVAAATNAMTAIRCGVGCGRSAAATTTAFTT
jgi:hypothetical protein